MVMLNNMNPSSRSLAVVVPARIVRTDNDIDTFFYHKRVAEE